ncbi:replication initiator protein [Flyfo microvirus Tbat2_163]|nr:replication initiator protein [Flyfo microvirus Tbat2_163]
MQCTSPIYLRTYNFFVPCRKCRSCKIARVREWSIRMMHELPYHSSAVFLTLTYTDDNLPEDGLSKEHVQAFFKRLRFHIKPGKIKYFAVGEYGEKTTRAHYHAIVFGLSFADTKLIDYCWRHGFVHVGTVTPDSCRYVVGYLHKKMSSKACPYSAIGLRPLFQLQSQGLGLQFALDNSDMLCSRLHLRYLGKRVALPRYYLSKLPVDKETLSQRAVEFNEKAMKKVISLARDGLLKDYLRVCGEYEHGAGDYILERIRPHNNATIEAKESLKSRNKHL